MIIVDTALEKREAEGNPIRVALVGAGYMGRGIATQIINSTTGMRLVGISNRTMSEAERAYRESGVEDFQSADTVAQVEDAVNAGKPVTVADAMLLCQAGNIDAIIDATGEIEFGAHVVTEAIKCKKHVILMNAELDATVGPILRVHADRQGVVLTYGDGDEPAVAMNLFRFLKGIGYEPVLMGQIKGFLNRYRNPETQQEFAKTHKQKAAMVASFADGSKLCLESTLMGNATGFKPATRGMYGFDVDDVKDILPNASPEMLTGVVDFALGAAPHTGAFVVGYNENPVKQAYMQYFKMGQGPYYMFYTPYHLPHLQLPMSVARAVLFHDPTLVAKGAPVCDTLAVAKKDLKPGEVLDGMGGFTCYGLIDSYDVCHAENYLPMALSIGCTLKNPIAKDHPISYADVELPEGRLCDQLRAEQTAHFGAAQPVG